MFRCYADSLANKTLDEIKDIYADYTNPSCHVFGGNNKELLLAEQSPSSIVIRSLLESVKGSEETEETDDDEGEVCKAWIYDLDYGYKSMTSEVSCELKLGL